MPLDQLRAVLDELAEAGVLSRRRRAGIEYPIWSTVHGWQCSPGKGPCATPQASPATSSKKSPATFIEAALA